MKRGRIFWGRLAFVAALAAAAAGFIGDTRADEKKQGRIYHGRMFKHYDLDGDGKIEEWRRGSWRHLDSNKDGKPEVFRRGEGTGKFTQGWDSDGDGVYDMAQDIVEGIVPEVGPEYPIEIPTPAAAIRRDQVLRIESVAVRKSNPK